MASEPRQPKRLAFLNPLLAIASSLVFFSAWIAAAGCRIETSDLPNKNSSESSLAQNSTSHQAAKKSDTEPAESKSDSSQTPTTKSKNPPDGKTNKKAKEKSTDKSKDVQKKPPTRIPNKRPVVITFDDLELKLPVNSKFSPEVLTPRVKELDGERVTIKGFIYAAGVFKQTGIQQFPLVKNTQCKFGPGGLSYCVILVSLDDGVETDFTLQPITVEGILQVEPFSGPDGVTYSMYKMTGEKVN
jgi:hypothetical protein